MNPHIFRAYDIRGLADRDLDDDLVRDIGQGIGTLLRRSGGRSLALGRDCRTHSPRLHRALLSGLLMSGVEVHDVGIVPSPLLYFAAHHLKTSGGVEITGSHNPPSDNGFKIVLGQHPGQAPLHGQRLEALRELVVRRDFVHENGTVQPVAIADEYCRFVRSRLMLGARRFPVVLDAGNGTGGAIAVPLIQELGFPLTPLHCDMDGRFPFHPPDPTVPENLIELVDTVRETGAELGLAFDGDADRLAVVDSRGRILWGDELLILLARAILAEEPGATFVCEVKCSKAVLSEIARAGGRVVMWRVGHSEIRDKMREVGAALGGEMSGHIFFSHRYLGFDDAIYAALRLLELLSRDARPLASHVDTLPRLHHTPEIRRPAPEPSKFEIVRRATTELRALPDAEVIELDGARVHWPDAWALLRASNTQAALVLRFEADSAERLQAVRKLVDTMLDRVIAALEAEQKPPTLEFYYDLACPYSYLAATQLSVLCARTGAALRYRPMVLGRVSTEEYEPLTELEPRHLPTRPFMRQSAARLRYLQTDLGRWARRLRVGFHFPSRYPINTIQALRLCVQAQERSESLHQALTMRLFRAYWVYDEDLLDSNVLSRALAEVGLPADELLAGCTRLEVKEALRSQTEAAIARGVFGAPSFFVGDELFVGSDRLDFIEEALRSLTVPVDSITR